MIREFTEVKNTECLKDPKLVIELSKEGKSDNSLCVHIFIPLHPTGKRIRRNPMVQPFISEFLVQLSSQKKLELSKHK